MKEVPVRRIAQAAITVVVAALVLAFVTGEQETRSQSPPTYTLSNWSAETFPIAVNRFECLSWFDGVLLSGQVKLLKPDRRIFEIFLDAFQIEPSRAIYID